MIQSFRLVIAFVHEHAYFSFACLHILVVVMHIFLLSPTSHASFPFLRAHRIYCDRVVVEVLKSTAAGGPSPLHVEVTSPCQIHPQTGGISLVSSEDVDGCCFAQIPSYVSPQGQPHVVDLKKM
jgi:hypothetical protein